MREFKSYFEKRTYFKRCTHIKDKLKKRRTFACHEDLEEAQRQTSNEDATMLFGSDLFPHVTDDIQKAMID